MVEAVHRFGDDNVGGVIGLVNRAFERDRASRTADGRRLLARGRGMSDEQKPDDEYACGEM
jgi:hypothetical protein